LRGSRTVRPCGKEGILTEASSSGASLLFSIGARFCALPIEHVVETMRPLPVEAISGAPDIVSGVAVVRGVPLPVIDGAALLGDARTTAPGRFITVRVGERRAVLAVHSIQGVRLLPTTSLHELAPLLRDAAAEIVAKIGALDARLLLVLQTMRLLPESLWRSLDARAKA
jgi:purine-binding chemotaxis protein CheW